jgi:hypothetical protein
MDIATVLWLLGICVGVIVGLIAVVYKIHDTEISLLRKSVHDLRNTLPDTIVKWLEFFKKVGK